MSEALEKVRTQLGGDAVILHTRTIKRGGLFGVGARSLVEITATRDDRLNEVRRREAVSYQLSAISQTPPPKAAAPALTLPRGDGGGCLEKEQPPPAEGSIKPDADFRNEINEIRRMVGDLVQDNRRARCPDVPAEMIDWYADLIGRDVAEELALDIMRRVDERLRDSGRTESTQHPPDGSPATDTERVRSEIAACLMEMVPPAAPLALTRGGGPTVVALVGPTGVGKTTTIAKLAANVKLRERKRVGLITIDTYRIAAVEQLKTYAEILDIPLVAVLTPDEMRAAIAGMADRDLILIDTAGRSQKDEVRIGELARFLDAAKPHQIHLVQSLTSRPETIRETVERFGAVGADHVIFTKIDEAVGFGVILNVLQSVKMRLSYLTNGQSVPDDIEPGSARRVAELILAGPRPEPAWRGPVQSPAGGRTRRRSKSSTRHRQVEQQDGSVGT